MICRRDPGSALRQIISPAYNAVHMGQVALGFKNLLIKVVIFVIMAALLAWALGGTLLPRPKRASFQDGAVQFNGEQWYWRVLLDDTEMGPLMQWTLMRGEEPWMSPRIAADPYWLDRTDLVVANDSLYFAGYRPDPGGAPWWFLVRISREGDAWFYLLPDRLAVEQQLERIRTGLPLQGQQVIEDQRRFVLDPDQREATDDEER